jgi:hypothetical protein
VSGATGQERENTRPKQVTDFESEQNSHSTKTGSFFAQNWASPLLAFGVHSLVSDYGEGLHMVGFSQADNKEALEIPGPSEGQLMFKFVVT